MTPEDNYINPQEYLDQISPKKPGRFNFLDKKILILGGAVIVLIIMIIVWFAVSSTPKQSPASELLTLRLQNMSTLLDYDNSKITDSKNKKVVAETRIIFASNNYQLSQFTTSKTSSEVATKEPISQITATLDAASSANDFSQKYVSALSTQINQIINSLEEIQLQSGSAPINKALLDFSELSTRLSGN